MDPGTILAVIGFADQVIVLCKFYLETAKDAPSDIRAMLVEVATVKTILDTLQFMMCSAAGGYSGAVQSLISPGGPVDECHGVISDLEKLFPAGILTKCDAASKGAGERTKKQRAKAILAALAWPLHADKAQKLLRRLGNLKQTITLALTTNSAQTIQEIQSTTRELHKLLTVSQRMEIYRWLDCTDPSPRHNLAVSQYVEGTAEWIFRCPEWGRWIDLHERCFWIHGIPGAGKTILASNVIRALENHCALKPPSPDGNDGSKLACVYYYCYFGNDQDESGPLLRWLVDQLGRLTETVPPHLYDCFQSGRQPSVPQILTALEQLLALVGRVFVVIDAVDESKERHKLLKVLHDLANDHRFTKLQLLVTSREYVDIERTMSKISVHLSMSNPLVTEDIRRCVRDTLTTNPKFRRWPSEIMAEVEEVIPRKADGMFRWAVCQMDSLRRLPPTKEAIMKALKNLPKDLEEVYTRLFEAIPEEEVAVVRHVLSWMYFHQNLHQGSIPCQTVLQALSRSPDAPATPCSYNTEDLQDLCGCLVTVAEGFVFARRPDYGSGRATVLLFAHYTVREFLESPRISGGPAASFALSVQVTHRPILKLLMEEGLKCHHSLEVEDKQTRSARKVWWHELYGGDPPHDVRQDRRADEALHRITANFTVYAAVSIRFLEQGWPNCWAQLSDDDAMIDLAFAVIDLSAPHGSVIHDVQFAFAGFWRWVATGRSDPDALMLLSVYDCFGACFESMAERLFRRSGRTPQDILFSQVVVAPLGNRMGSGLFQPAAFRGPVLELFCNRSHPRWLSFVLRHSEPTTEGLTRLLMLRIYNTRRPAPRYFRSPSEGSVEDSNAPQLETLLLARGADPAGKGRPVTPLQVAAWIGNVRATEILLQHGADPDGDACASNQLSGDLPEVDSLLPYLRERRPLVIAEDCGCHHRVKKATWVGNRTRYSKIKALLLQYGAREFEGHELEELGRRELEEQRRLQLEQDNMENSPETKPDWSKCWSDSEDD